MLLQDTICSLEQARYLAAEVREQGRELYLQIEYSQFYTTSKWLLLPAREIALDEESLSSLIEDIRDIYVWNPEGAKIDISSKYFLGNSDELQLWLSERRGRVVIWDNVFYSFGLYAAEVPVVNVLRGRFKNLPDAFVNSGDPFNGLAELCLEASLSPYSRTGLIKLLNSKLPEEHVHQILASNPSSDTPEIHKIIEEIRLQKHRLKS